MAIQSRLGSSGKEGNMPGIHVPKQRSHVHILLVTETGNHISLETETYADNGITYPIHRVRYHPKTCAYILYFVCDKENIHQTFQSRSQFSRITEVVTSRQ